MKFLWPSQNIWTLGACHAHFSYLARASCKFPRARDLSSRFVVPFVSTPSLMVLNCKLKIKFSTSICKPFCSSSTYWLDMVYRKRGFHRNINNIRLHIFKINCFFRLFLTKKIDFESQILALCTDSSQCNNFIEYNDFLPKHLLLKM